MLKYLKNMFIGFLIIFSFSFSIAQSSDKFESPVFNDLSGEKISLNTLKGQITIVNFWATWCATCLREMPELQKIYQEFKDEQVNVVGVAVMSDTGQIEKMVKVTKVTYPILIGTRQDLQKISPNLTIPQTIILDRQGKILAHLNSDQTYKSIHNVISNLLQHRQLSEGSQENCRLTKE